MIALKITPAGDISCVNVRNLAQLSKVLNGSSSFVLNNDYRFRVYFSDFCKYIKLPINNLANIILKFFAIDDYLSGDCYITSIDTNGGKSTSLSYSQIDFLYSIVGLYNPNNYYQNYFSNIDLASKIIDADGLIYTHEGLAEGGYAIDYVNTIEKIELLAYAGVAGYDPSTHGYHAINMHYRLLQELKLLTGPNFEYWSGLPNFNDWKIRVRKLFIETDHRKRLQKESDYIRSLPEPPLLQNPKYGLYPSKGYNRPDLACYPWKNQRSKILQDRLTELKTIRK